MNIKRLIVAGIVASILFLVLDAIFGVLGGWIGELISGIPPEQPDDAKLATGLVFELINGFMLVIIYAVIYPALPGEGGRRGISYGLIVWGLRVVMWAFSTYMLTDMPPVLISITVITGLVEMLIICVVIAIIYTGKKMA